MNMMMKTTLLAVTSCAAIACATDDAPPVDDASDGRDDIFLLDGKADTGGVVEGSAEAIGVLKLVNTASESVLDIDVRLDRRAAENIVYYRLGDDGVSGSADDETFDTLAELDAIPWVGPVAFQRMLEYALDNGYVDTDPDPADEENNGTTIVIGPPDLRGYIDVSLPAPVRDDWAPASPVRYGPNNQLTYDPGLYHVYSGTTKIASADVGNRVFLPKGRYRVAMNDTHVDVTVDAGETTSIAAGRLEVDDVAGTFAVNVVGGDFSNGSQLLDTNDFPTGVGLNVMPGDYRVEVSYQAHTKRFDANVAPGQVEVVEPNDLRGHFVLEAPPAARHPDWAPDSAPRFGPNNRHTYDNDTYYVYKGTELLETLNLGEPFYGPEGTYTVALNDTKTSFTIARGETARLEASRLEVADVSGTFEVSVNGGDFSNGSQLLDTSDFPTGVGMNVLPGSYRVSVAYQAHTKRFDAAIQPGEVYVVEPDDLRGYLRVDAPTGVTLPDWAPATPPRYGPNNALTYDNGVYHVYKGTTKVGTARLGESVFAPEGSYTVVVNDTKTTMSVVAQETRSIRAGRLEVNDVDGTVQITARGGDFSNGSQVLDANDIPTGFGINVMPGDYRVSVAYQTHTNNFDVTVP